MAAGPQPRAAELDQLFPLVYDQLRTLARRYVARSEPCTLRPTELVHETYLRLAHQGYVDWRNRAHVIGLAARMMRRVLVDRARRRGSIKRGNGHHIVSLDLVPEPAVFPTVDLLSLDAALTSLTALDARQARVVELRIFGGQGIDETAAVLGISPATVKREWKLAKAWLLLEVERAETRRGT